MHRPEKRADGYSRGGHTKHSMMVHLIFVTKYRKYLFFGTMDDDIKQILSDISSSLNISVRAMETDKDHIHMLIQYKPNMSISDIVGQLKQRSTYEMWQRHEKFLKYIYWKHKVLWSDGYFACSIGQVSQKP